MKESTPSFGLHPTVPTAGTMPCPRLRDGKRLHAPVAHSPWREAAASRTNPKKRMAWKSPSNRQPGAAAPLAKIAGCALSVALAASALCAPCTAYAAEGTTDVLLVANDEQISVTVPASLPVAVKTDGTFVVPTLSIENNSVFDVHVDSIKALTAPDFSLVAEEAFAESDGDNTLWMSLESEDGESVDLASCIDLPGQTDSSKWVVERRASESQPGTLSVSGDGAIKDFTLASETGREALSVSFTIKAGR